MPTSNTKKQKLIIQDILSSVELYTRVANILKREYFDKDYGLVVDFIHKYYSKYNSVPDADILDAEFDIEFEPKKLSRDRLQSSSDEIEMFCRESAVRDAIYSSLEDVDNQRMSVVLDRISKAVNVSLQRDMGIDVFFEPEERLESLVEIFKGLLIIFVDL